jgi:hypothetical protein
LGHKVVVDVLTLNVPVVAQILKPGQNRGAAVQPIEEATHILKELEGWALGVNSFKHDAKQIPRVTVTKSVPTDPTVRLTGRASHLTGDSWFLRPFLAVEQIAGEDGGIGP